MCLVAPLVALTQWFARPRLALHRVHEAQRLEHLPLLAARVCPVRMHRTPGVVHVQHLIEVVPVVFVGRARADPSDEAVLEVHAHTELVAEVAFAVLVRVRGVQVLLPALGFAPFGQGLALLPVQVLAGRGYQRRIDGLATPGDIAVAL